MASAAEIDAVLKNGAGLPADTALRDLLRVRHRHPDDTMSKAMESDQYCSLFFDEEKLLNPEQDYFIHWTDFTSWYDNWFDAELDGKLARIARMSQDVIELDSNTIYNYNFIVPVELPFGDKPGCLAFESLSICLDNFDAIQILMIARTRSGVKLLDQEETRPHFFRWEDNKYYRLCYTSHAFRKTK